MLTAKERIVLFINNQQITINQFCKKNLLSNSFFNNKSAIGSDKLQNIFINYPELNMDWVITGRGEMIFESNQKLSNMKGKNDEILVENIKKIVQDSGLRIDIMMKKLRFTIKEEDDDEENINEYRQMILTKKEPDEYIMEAVYNYLRQSGYSEKQIENFESEYLDKNLKEFNDFKMANKKLKKTISEKSPDRNAPAYDNEPQLTIAAEDTVPLKRKEE